MSLSQRKDLKEKLLPPKKEENEKDSEELRSFAEQRRTSNIRISGSRNTLHNTQALRGSQHARLSEEFKPALALLSTIQTICQHPAWNELTHFSQSKRPEGIQHILNNVSGYIHGTNTKNDTGVTVTYDSIKRICDKKRQQFLFTRDPLTEAFYKILSKVTINSQHVAQSTLTLQKELESFHNKLQDITNEKSARENQPSCFRCFF